MGSPVTFSSAENEHCFSLEDANKVQLGFENSLNAWAGHFVYDRTALYEENSLVLNEYSASQILLIKLLQLMVLILWWEIR